MVGESTFLTDIKCSQLTSKFQGCPQRHLRDGNNVNVTAITINNILGSSHTRSLLEVLPFAISPQLQLNHLSTHPTPLLHGILVRQPLLPVRPP